MEKYPVFEVCKSETVHCITCISLRTKTPLVAVISMEALIGISGFQNALMQLSTTPSNSPVVRGIPLFVEGTVFTIGTAIPDCFYSFSRE